MFIGRSVELHKLLSRDPNRVYVSGPTGMGKSELLRQVNKKLTADGYRCLFFTIEPNSSNFQDVAVSLMDQLLAGIESSDLSLSSFLEFAQKNMSGILWNTFGALCSDGLNHLAPSLKQTSDDIYESIRSISRDQDISVTAEDIVSKHENVAITLIDLLLKFNEQNGKAAIILDRLESASEDTMKFVLGLAAALPEEFALFLAINSEVDDGNNILGRWGPELAYGEFACLSLEPISIEDLCDWYARVNGENADPDTVREVFDKCEGRTLYLKDWVEGKNIDGVEDAIARKIGPFYVRRLNNLSEDAKNLVYSLSVLPEKIHFHVNLLRKITGASPLQITHITKELCEKDFLVQEGNRYRFTHETVRRNTRSQINNDLIGDISKDLWQCLRDDDVIRSDPFIYIALAHQAKSIEDFDNNALATAQTLREQGLIGASNEVYKMMRQSGEDTSVPIMLGEIQNNLILGNYGICLSTIEQLRTVEEGNNIRTKLDLLEAKCNLRLNKYNQSVRLVERVLASDSKLVDEQIDALRTVNTIYRDRGEHRKALEVANQLLSLYESSSDVSSLTEPRVYRTVARTFASSGNVDDAVHYAGKAIAAAKRLNSIHDLEDSYLAQAEAFRFKGTYSDSIGMYKASIDLASKTNNKDCLLWATIGLTDAYVLSGELEQATRAADSIGKYLRDGKETNPIEYLHWQLNYYSISFLKRQDQSFDLNDLLSGYAQLGIKWPKNFIKGLQEGQVAPKTF